MPPLISQPNKPQSNRLRLKPLQWIVPLVILSALVGGYFAYQNYMLQKTTREITAPTPALSSDAVTLDDYNGKKVEVQGSLKEGYPVDDGPQYMQVVAVKEMK